MSSEFPRAGQVIDYPYLWKWQCDHGETEGRKFRPCCVSVVVRQSGDKTLLFMAPITSKSPPADRVAIEIPLIEARRAHLDQDRSLWIIIDELNIDIVERSYVLGPDNVRGAFSTRFIFDVVNRIQQLRATGHLSLASRV